MRAWLAATFSERARLFLLSLGIAVTMWYYVGSANAPADRAATASLHMRDVGVTVVGLAAGWTVTTEPRTVDVEMRGPATILAMRASQVRVIADVSTLEPGPHQVILRIQTPRDVTLAKATPPAVQVTLLRP